MRNKLKRERERKLQLEGEMRESLGENFDKEEDMQSGIDEMREMV